MPMLRALTKVAKKTLLAPGCGCQVSAVAVRHVSFSPRQVTNASDASFHSVSFSETDHPKVLITGMTCTPCIYHYLISMLMVVRCSVFIGYQLQFAVIWLLCFFTPFQVALGN